MTTAFVVIIVFMAGFYSYSKVTLYALHLSLIGEASSHVEPSHMCPSMPHGSVYTYA